MRARVYPFVVLCLLASSQHASADVLRVDDDANPGGDGSSWTRAFDSLTDALAAATSGDARFFLGTDSAPHVDAAKESACGCAGCFTAPNALAVVAEIFDEADALDRLEGFASLHGPGFYGLPVNDAQLTLRKSGDPTRFPAKIDTGDGPVTVFDPGFDVFWAVSDQPA